MVFEVIFWFSVVWLAYVYASYSLLLGKVGGLG